MSEFEAAAIATQLAADGDVAYVVPDRRVKLHFVPNDARHSFQEPYLGNTAAAISAYAAWDTTTGSASVIVAVVDSGIRPHEDLTGRVLPGYDFVAELARANDGDGRDADPSDPGDWIDAADLASDAFKGDDNCKLSPSVWHGTAVASVIAANTNNGIYGLRHRLGREDPAGAGDRQVRRLRLRHHRRHGLGGRAARSRRARQPDAGASHQHEPGRRRELRRALPATRSAAVYAHGITRAIIASAGNDGEQWSQYTRPDAPASSPSRPPDVDRHARELQQLRRAHRHQSAPGGETRPSRTQRHRGVDSEPRHDGAPRSILRADPGDELFRADGDRRGVADAGPGPQSHAVATPRDAQVDRKAISRRLGL